MSFVWFDFDQDNFTYDVKYNDSNGRPCTNRCKVRGWSFWIKDDTLYWAHSI